MDRPHDHEYARPATPDPLREAARAVVRDIDTATSTWDDTTTLYDICGPDVRADIAALRAAIEEADRG